MEAERRGFSGETSANSLNSPKTSTLWPEDCPGRRAVAVPDFHRQANQIVLARFHFRQIQTLDDPHAGAEQDLVAFHAVALVAAHRKVIDPDRADVAVHHVLSGFL